MPYLECVTEKMMRFAENVRISGEEINRRLMINLEDIKKDLGVVSPSKHMAESVMKDSSFNRKGRICFDFDGVIHSYVSGWHGNNVANDPPVPGIAEVIRKLYNEGWEIYVHSSRCATLAGLQTIQNYLNRYEIPYTDITPYKPAAKIYVDDRAICFDGNSEKLLRQIRNFKSYLEKGDEFAVGDKIHLDDRYTATCQKVGKKGAIFLFDQYLDMDKNPVILESIKILLSRGNQQYEGSSLPILLNEILSYPMFDNIRGYLIPFKNGDFLRIPTAEEMFGEEHTRHTFKRLKLKKQWELMKDPVNRRAISLDGNKKVYGLLQNNYIFAGGTFACVDPGGELSMVYSDLATMTRIRIAFRLDGGVLKDKKVTKL